MKRFYTKFLTVILIASIIGISSNTALAFSLSYNPARQGSQHMITLNASSAIAVRKCALSRQLQ